MYCADCGKVFHNKVDFYEHLIYNEGYDEDSLNRLVNVGFLTVDEKVEIINIMTKDK
jgi:hypothetical protein